MDRPKNYVPYHMHSMLSNGTTNIDSITNFRDYVELAQRYNMKAFGISEHGNIFEWLHKKEAIEAAGMKYLHGIEAYLTNDNAETKSKTRDNYHCVLIAKNYDGVRELNKMSSAPHAYNRNDHHFYYMPRITLDELFATSDNILITTACLGGVLHNGTDEIRDKMINFLSTNRHRCWLEIQHHNCQDQIDYNKYLYTLSKEINVPLIAGTDTHALNDEHMKGRAMLQRAKDVHFDNEDTWDMTFKSVDELIEAYKKQNALPIDVVYEAIDNTNRMADMVEEFKIDYNAKYPKLYTDSEGEFKKKINEGFVRRGIANYPNVQEYKERIHYEYETYKHNNAIDFMLLEEDYKSEMRRRNIKYGYSRGSVSGSIIAYLLGITEVDSVKYGLNFERFMNTERVSLADIDTDWFTDDRNTVRDYLYGKKGLYCCDIVTFNTIAVKGAIRDICRAFHYENLEHLPDAIKKEIAECDKQNSERTKNNGFSWTADTESYPDSLIKEIEQCSVHKEVPYDYMEFSNTLSAMVDDDEEKARKKYPDIFKYVDLVNGVVVSVGNHPSACVVSPYPVDEWFGTFTTAGDDYPVSVLNMKEIDALKFVKLDILGLDNIGLIYKTCDLAGIPFATPDNIPPDDMDVWNSIRDDTTMIFQWESQSATQYLKQLFSESTIEKIRAQNPNFSYIDLLSIGNGAIRPAGESYRDKLAQGIYQDNGHKALNDFLAPTLGYLVYQEQIIEFLHSFCGYTMGEADIVRRGFAKKTGTEQFIPKIKEGFNKTMLEQYGVDNAESERIIVNFIKVIEDASSYLFSKNHSDPYSWIGYICGYLRYHYPLEFITTALNIFESKEEKSIAIINYAKKQNIKISPIKFRYSIAKYNFDKDSNEIFKGISSIKFLNATVADEIYELRNNQYDSFSELLYDLQYKTSANSRQIKILIELDFFSEFGDANKLLAIYNITNEFAGKKQFKKDKLAAWGISEDAIRPFAEKESEKMFTRVNTKDFLVMVEKEHIIYQPRSLKEKIKAQTLHLGYIDIMDDRYAGMGAVLDVNTKYAPRLQIYSLKNGTIVDCKIDKRTFNSNKLKVGDLLRIQGQRWKPKLKRLDDGHYEPVPGVNELWVTKYTKINDI